LALGSEADATAMRNPMCGRASLQCTINAERRVKTAF